jgi:small subunit ribosomal protein S24e
MNVKILTRQKNPLLAREEIGFEVVEAKITPSRKELVQKIAALVNGKEDSVSIEKIEQNYGSKTIRGTAKVYADAEKMKCFEPKFKIERTFGKQEEKKEKVKDAAPASEKPAEEKKEQAVESEKQEEKKEEPKEDAGKQEEKKE